MCDDGNFKIDIFSLSLPVMKRILSILFTIIPVMSMIGITVIPHHHHDGMACVITQHCDVQDYGHECGNHHHGDPDSKTKCIGESEFTSKISREETCTLLSGHNHKTECCPAILQYLFSVSFGKDLPEVSSGYGEPPLNYRSVDLIRSSGLRGPPSFLS